MAEVAQPSDESDEYQSELFSPLTIEVAEKDTDGVVLARRFYLANTDAIVEPCIVIPDIGGESNAYWQVEPRRVWSDKFVAWLRAPHADDVIGELSDDD